MFRAYDGNHAPKDLSRVNNSDIVKNMEFCFAFHNGQLRDSGPKQWAIKNIVQDASFSDVYSPGLGKYGKDFGTLNQHSYWEIDTGGRGILSPLSGASYFIWLSGLTSFNDSISGDTSYSERSDATSIWKFVTHGDNSAENNIVFIHRDDGNQLSRPASLASVEDGGLHLVGFTKRGKAIRYYKDGIFTASATLLGDDDLTRADPVIGVDLQDISLSSYVNNMFMQYGWSRTLSDAECFNLFNPATRYDMFAEERVIGFVAPVVGGLPSWNGFTPTNWNGATSLTNINGVTA